MSAPLLAVLVVIALLLGWLAVEVWLSGRTRNEEYNDWCGQVDRELREREGRQP